MVDHAVEYDSGYGSFYAYKMNQQNESAPVMSSQSTGDTTEEEESAANNPFDSGIDPEVLAAMAAEESNNDSSGIMLPHVTPMPASETFNLPFAPSVPSIRISETSDLPFAPTVPSNDFTENYNKRGNSINECPFPFPSHNYKQADHAPEADYENYHPFPQRSKKRAQSDTFAVAPETSTVTPEASTVAPEASDEDYQPPSKRTRRSTQTTSFPIPTPQTKNRPPPDANAPLTRLNRSKHLPPLAQVLATLNASPHPPAIEFTKPQRRRSARFTTNPYQHPASRPATPPLPAGTPEGVIRSLQQTIKSLHETITRERTVSQHFQHMARDARAELHQLRMNHERVVNRALRDASQGHVARSRLAVQVAGKLLENQLTEGNLRELGEMLRGRG